MSIQGKKTNVKQKKIYKNISLEFNLRNSSKHSKATLQCIGEKVVSTCPPTGSLSSLFTTLPCWLQRVSPTIIQFCDIVYTQDSVNVGESIFLFYVSLLSFLAFFRIPEFLNPILLSIGLECIHPISFRGCLSKSALK